MFISQLLNIAIPSTSGQAAVTMPILGPVGEISGVSPQTTVLHLMGNGLTNMITPTSSGLLIFLQPVSVGPPGQNIFYRFYHFYGNQHWFTEHRRYHRVLVRWI